VRVACLWSTYVVCVPFKRTVPIEADEEVSCAELVYDTALVKEEEEDEVVCARATEEADNASRAAELLKGGNNMVSIVSTRQRNEMKRTCCVSRDGRLANMAPPL
jgi:hypothetical protein